MQHKYNPHDDIKRILAEVPEISTHGYIDELIQSLNKSKQNLRPDNPFLRVKGEYIFHLDTTESGVEKIGYIHKKITDYLFENTGKVFVFKPGDNSKVYTLDDDKISFKVSRLLKDAPNDIKKLVTQYPQTKKSKIKIKISTDPLDIVKKSTHQSWTSCETIGGGFCRGIFSDIENNNAIAYVYIDDNTKANGRFMLRWCSTPEDKVDIGIEPIMYPRKSYSLEIYELLRGIINSKGYGTYDECKTPYEYKGYSDYIGGSGVITYHSGTSDTVLIQYASMPDISRNLALALAEHTTPVEVRRALAENTAVCEIEDAVNKLSKDIDDDTKMNLIHTCSIHQSDSGKKNMLSETAIENLIKDNEDIRSRLAQYIYGVKEEYLEKLAKDDSLFVRTALARNRYVQCCDKIIETLASDKDIAVKEELINSQEKLTRQATNLLVDSVPSTTGFKTDSDRTRNDELFMLATLSNKKFIGSYPEVVRKLADKNDPYIKTRLATNTAIKCCDDVIDRLAGNSPNVSVELLRNPVVSKSARKKAVDNTIQKTSDEYGIQLDKYHDVYTELVNHPEICEYKDVIDTIVNKGDKMHMERLAMNQHISCMPDIIKKIADSSDSSTTAILASNPAISNVPDIAEKLYMSGDEHTQENLLRNPVSMSVKSITDDLTRAIDRLKTNINHRNKPLSEVSLRPGGLLKIGYYALIDTIVQNPNLIKQKTLFDKIYEIAPSEILSFNPKVFEIPYIIDREIENADMLASLASNESIVNYPHAIKKILDINEVGLLRILYDAISNGIQIKEEYNEPISQELRDTHEKLYNKIYPKEGGYDYLY